MNVLLICGCDHQYGSAQAAISLLKYSARHYTDINYIVVTQTEGYINTLCDSLGIENHVTGHAYSVIAPEQSDLKTFFKRVLKRLIVSAKNKKAVKAVEACIDMSSIDMIHTNIDRDIIGCYLAEKYHIPHMMHLREFARGHYNCEPLYDGQYSFYNRTVDAYAAISEAVGKSWEEAGLDQTRIHTVYDGIDYSVIARRDADRNDDDLKLVMCGDISSLKGQDQTVRAIAKIKEQMPDVSVTLDIYGEVHNEKQYMASLQEFITSNGLEKTVRFKGYSDQLNSLLQNYDCGVICSKKEGFGLATAEFMSAGLAVIACDTGANEELIRDGKSGLIYKYGDISDLAEKISILARSRELIYTYSEQAYTDITEKFSIARNCSEIRNMYFMLKKE